MVQQVKDSVSRTSLGSMLIGNIHLLPLPGSQQYQGGGLKPIIERALAEARILEDAGFDAILIQNTGDGRFHRDGRIETVSYMTAIGAELKARVSCRFGVNVLSVGASASLAIAHALAFDFVRIKVYIGAVVTAEGTIDGAYQEAIEYRERIGASGIAIAADVFDRSSWQLGEWSIGDAARYAHNQARADILVITGRSTEDSLARAREVKAAVPLVPVWCGGGTNPENIGQMLGVYDGAIVGMGIKPQGKIGEPFSASLAQAYVRAGQAARRRS